MDMRNVSCEVVLCGGRRAAGKGKVRGKGFKKRRQKRVCGCLGIGRKKNVRRKMEVPEWTRRWRRWCVGKGGAERKEQEENQEEMLVARKTDASFLNQHGLRGASFRSCGGDSQSSWRTWWWEEGGVEESVVEMVEECLGTMENRPCNSSLVPMFGAVPKYHCVPTCWQEASKSTQRQLSMMSCWNW